MAESKQETRDEARALIKSLSQFKTNPLPDIFITEVVAPENIREWNKELKKRRIRRSKDHCIKEHSESLMKQNFCPMRTY